MQIVSVRFQEPVSFILVKQHFRLEMFIINYNLQIKYDLILEKKIHNTLSYGIFYGVISH